MHKATFALTVFLLAAGTLGCRSTHHAAAASEDAAVMAPVHQFVDGFNKGDIKSATAACADQMSIIDEIPPYEWHGLTAMSKWLSDYEADAKKNGISDGYVTLGSPRHVDITGDRAYVVAAADYKYKEKGKSVSENGSIITIALQKTASGWRIAGWSWARS